MKGTGYACAYVFLCLKVPSNKNLYSTNHGLSPQPQFMPLTFLTLKESISSITSSLTGVAGVYMLINRNDPSRFYIGSSVNLGRRLGEYYDLINGLRQAKTASERELSSSPASQ